jgi:putative transposase
MARLARIVVPGVPHHVTQRGNRRMDVFFSDDDHRAYLDLLAEWCGKAGTELWAYCLMPNHVHLIMTPSDADGLRGALGEAHRRYTRRINFQNEWRGHLWQERFHSFPMDDDHLVACARYVELNPVRAGLVARPEDWAWSSARAHLTGRDDGIVSVSPLIERIGDWRAFLDGGLPDDMLQTLRGHSRTGRPAGDGGFIERLETLSGRTLKKQKPGPRKISEQQ